MVDDTERTQNPMKTIHKGRHQMGKTNMVDYGGVTQEPKEFSQEFS